MIDNPVFASFVVNNYFPKKLQPQIRGAELSLDEYAEYQRLLGTVDIDGMTLMEAMRETVANFEDGVTVGPNGTQRSVLAAIRLSYKLEAEFRMMEEYPDLELRIDEAVDRAMAPIEESVPFDQMNVGDKSMENIFKGVGR